MEQTLRLRLDDVERRLADACRRAGRARDDVTLVGVTKAVSSELARELHRLGVIDLGENRPQELWRKTSALASPVRWHLIGHLQRNKIERTLPLVHLIHSVDSMRLLEALDDEAVKQDRTVAVLLEINASRETQKHGFEPEELAEVVARLGTLRNIHVQGLMTMAALHSDSEQSRPTFALLRELRDRLGARVHEPHALAHLSMGMSNDFEVAIEEGASLVRLGSVLFEGIAEGAP